MLPARGNQQTLGQKLRTQGALAGAVLHYSVCAFAITLGSLGFVYSVVGLLSAEHPTVPFLGLIAFAVIFVLELVYRPALTLTAAIGFCALLLLCSWLATNILVSVTF